MGTRVRGCLADTAGHRYVWVRAGTSVEKANTWDMYQDLSSLNMML